MTLAFYIGSKVVKTGRTLHTCCRCDAGGGGGGGPGQQRAGGRGEAGVPRPPPPGAPHLLLQVRSDAQCR